MPPTEPAVRPFYEEVTGAFDAVLARGHLDDDPALIRQVAVMHRHLAGVLEPVGKEEEALSHLDRSIRLLRPLPGRIQDPRDRAWTEFDLFRSLSRQSYAFSELGELASALAASEEAVGIIRGLIDRYPSDPAWSEALARHLLLRGEVLRQLGLHDRSLDTKREALHVAEKAARLAKDDPVKLNTLLTSLVTMADTLALEADKERYYGEAVEVARRLGHLHASEDWATRDAQVLALMNLADFYRTHARSAEAIPLYQEAAPIVQNLILQAPEWTQNQDRLRKIAERISECRGALGVPTDSE
ncbi:MAG: hypothetical protein U0790_01015 [Isosphaeraceae bacterium]